MGANDDKRPKQPRQGAKKGRVPEIPPDEPGPSPVKSQKASEDPIVVVDLAPRSASPDSAPPISIEPTSAPDRPSAGTMLAGIEGSQTDAKPLEADSILSWIASSDAASHRPKSVPPAPPGRVAAPLRSIPPPPVPGLPTTSKRSSVPDEQEVDGPTSAIRDMRAIAAEDAAAHPPEPGRASSADDLGALRNDMFSSPDVLLAAPPPPSSRRPASSRRRTPTPSPAGVREEMATPVSPGVQRARPRGARGEKAPDSATIRGKAFQAPAATDAPDARRSQLPLVAAWAIGASAVVGTGVYLYMRAQMPDAQPTPSSSPALGSPPPRDAATSLPTAAPATSEEPLEFAVEPGKPKPGAVGMPPAARASAADGPKPTAVPTATAAPTATAGAGGAEFDKAAARAALQRAAGGASACASDEAVGGTISVTFLPSGRVSTARFTKGSILGTPASGCAVAAFKGASVPAFSGEPVSVTWNVSVAPK